MDKKSIIQVVSTIGVLACLTVGIILSVSITPDAIAEKNTDLEVYYKHKKADIEERIKNVKFVSVMEYISKYADPIIAINTALEENRYVLFPKTLNVVLRGKIVPKSNSTIKIEAGARIVGSYPAFADPSEGCLFYFSEVENVVLLGNNAELVTEDISGTRKDFSPICIFGGDTISLFDLNLIHPMGQGIQISGSRSNMPKFTSSSDIDLFNININGAIRGGLLVRSIEGLKAYNLTISMTKGKPDENAISFYPENEDSELDDVQMQKIVTTQNNNVGLLIMPRVYLRSPISIRIKDYTSQGDNSLAPIYLMQSSMGVVELTNLKLSSYHKLSSIIRTWNTLDCPITITSADINGNKGFIYQVTDKPGDLFRSNLERLTIND